MSTALAAVTITCDDKAVKKAFQAVSLTASQKEATSRTMLRRRAEKDKEKFEEIAHYYGYYGAKIRYTITDDDQVRFLADLGQKYRLESCTVVPDVVSNLDILKLEPGQFITTQQVVDAEQALLWHLKKKGYAISRIAKCTCLADAKKQTLKITFEVDTGPIVTFGTTQVIGTQNVRYETVKKYITWKEGEKFNPSDIETTQNHLEKTGLFSSVVITEEKELADGSKLPITINVQESKHHSVGAGVAYASPYGPGVKAEWENKNLRGHGDTLTFRTEIWQKYQTVLLSLTKPHFHGYDQDLIWVAEYDKLRNIAFHSRSYNLSGILQKRIRPQVESLMGLRLEWLHSRNFEGSHFYHLVKLPLQFKWSNANNLLDPTKGETLNIKVTPATNFLAPSFFYVSQTTQLSGYYSIINNHCTLAAKLVLGNILGANRNTIPPPDRFYGGSENVMRGFRAYTVSPLHDHKTPAGGRSLLAASLEARFRTQGDFGYVLFYDVGNVYKKNVPELNIHQYHSVGAGLRYTTPIGPLRLDVAVPLNPRPHLDPNFQIYFSIGQSF